MLLLWKAFFIAMPALRQLVQLGKQNRTFQTNQFCNLLNFEDNKDSCIQTFRMIFLRVEYFDVLSNCLLTHMTVFVLFHVWLIILTRPARKGSSTISVPPKHQDTQGWHSRIWLQIALQGNRFPVSDASSVKQIWKQIK